MKKCKLCPVSLGLSLGLTWGLSVLIMGLVAHVYAYGKPFVAAVGALYIGYHPSISGSIIGGYTMLFQDVVKKNVVNKCGSD
jgi:hypothetical protein